MDVTPLVAAGRQMIEAYGDGGFRIAGIRHEGSVIVWPERTIAWESPELAPAAFALLAEAGERPALLLVGTGARLVLPARTLRAELKSAGVIADFMDTGAACRTFNVLLTEGRSVAAALMAV